MTTRCPACASNDTKTFYDGGLVPVHSCLLVSDEQAAVEFPRGELELAFCHACGFVYNQRFDPSHSAYSSEYEETQGFSPLFQAFIVDLARRWVGKYELAGKTVVELGCGKGEFLVETIRAGAGRGVGVDPGVHPDRTPDDVAGQITWVPGFFPQDYPELDVDAVVCRHTLEHIAPVAEWMRTVRAAIGERTETAALFELPDVARVLTEAAFWDVYYEHCSYFSAGSLARLFRRTGFEVVDLWPAYDNQYLVIEAMPTTTASPAESFPIENDLQTLAKNTEHFAAAQNELVGQWRNRLREAAARGERTVIWGSGSKGVAFLAALGEESSLISAAVDINPYKHGKYLAGSGHRIIAPKELADIRPAIVIAMNPTYLDEIGRDLESLGLQARLEAV